jgi:hypothetical protein
VALRWLSRASNRTDVLMYYYLALAVWVSTVLLRWAVVVC